MTASRGVTSTELIAAASEVLLGGGYSQISGKFPDWDTSSARLFEDKYNVVGVAVFDSCNDLLASWSDLQGSLVDVISRSMGMTESKSWDGYLVLLTPSVAPSEVLRIEEIRYDTNRLRKLIATGDELKDVGEAALFLRPLLPLEMEPRSPAPSSVLELLPDLLFRQNISPGTTETVIRAFREQAPIMERLHQLRD